MMMMTRKVRRIMMMMMIEDGIAPEDVYDNMKGPLA